MSRKLPRSILFGAIALWLALIIGGYAIAIIHNETPGDVRAVPAIAPNFRTTHLRVFLHPHCPCSKATLSELAAILERATEPLDVELLFVRPSGMPADWERSSTWTIAANLPGVRVTTDHDGTQAQRFGARTSGHCVLYDAGGTLRFSGGITRGRGHEGESAGRRAILNALHNHDVPASSAAVFGCPLFSSCEACTKADPS